MSRFFSSRYASLTPYTPGEQPQNRKYIKLNTNESPFPPSPGVSEAVMTEANRLQLYSDPESRLITQAIAEHYHLYPSQILVGNGSGSCDGFLRVRVESRQQQEQGSAEEPSEFND